MTDDHQKKNIIAGTFLGLVMSAAVAVLGVLGVFYFADRVRHNIAFLLPLPKIDGSVCDGRFHSEPTAIPQGGSND